MHKRVLSALMFCLFMIPGYSCARDDFFQPLLDVSFDDTVKFVEIIIPSGPVSSDSGGISIEQYAPLGISLQSAAAYGDYALFVTDGRIQMYLYNLAKKELLYSLALKGENRSVYHCNQSSFGVEKYDDADFFPLLYISQRAKSDGRCFVEVFRIIPHFISEIQEFDSFKVELVQKIYLPKMTSDNSLGNANCAIDRDNKWMYIYSRNNNSGDDNFEQCKITQFAIPDFHKQVVSLEDKDILSSFFIDANALYMQGGCINDGILYIGQGDPVAGFVYLNVVDLRLQEIVERYDLQKCGFNWEPEGCFYYGGSVMLAHTRAISRIKL